MRSNGSLRGSHFVLLAGVFALLVQLPIGVWITLSVIAGIVGVIALSIRAVEHRRTMSAAEVEQLFIGRAAEAAAAEERARTAWKQRTETLGVGNAALIDSALSALEQLSASEAARTGWLGDVDLAPDIRGIIDNFEKAHALRKVADTLSALDKPSDDDRRIVAEAKNAIANLERTASERVESIVKCAKEVHLIDKTLSDKRKEAKTAEQRAELHAKLSGMLYAIEPAPNTTAADSAIDAVMMRANAFREIMRSN
ncbi:hypothetical protein [Mycolicibacterium fortuitum]|uniref:Uncharacterized protein n=2 Tax=Mycolicibacterium fortuitum TaxID=1766 RepID=A0AAE4VKH8_MYCFO|nr:hypothetical protein [Mycolicibacterium fortuitum]MCV7138661.1 hypothetical protein [Mycolicibacterium fortuitum]MDV7189478.1 hypothetical protein [Mycolicibacterium fortuitum]MDV7202485.1 hypothetical protein [Mycolicibacterium fortuitum]MDV7230818.1 hypothetical protein [Mycolicibacterium fortuitum]MDV7256291.1 hypothetical protein [Mycolicibacterium fortuitum]